MNVSYMARRRLTLFTFAFCAALSNAALSGAALDTDIGADFRIRYDYKDNRPSPGGVQSTAYHDYFRLLSRVWFKASLDNVTFFSRFAEEFRCYHNAAQQRAFPDEGFIDNLYLDIADIADTVDLRIGRQDLRYGSGRLIRDGTPGDASRGWWFDAAVADIHLTQADQLSLFGMYQRPEDDWTLGHSDYDLTARTADGPNDLTESALGAYFTHAPASCAYPFDLYLIWKNESRYFRNGAARVPGRDFFTLGTRLMPVFSRYLSAETEMAVQSGRTDDGRDILAALGYAGLKTHLAPDSARKPYLLAGLLWLSGDQHADRGSDHNWNPVFNRSTWFSELAADQYSKYAWANLLYPHAEAGFSPIAGHTASLEAGPMFATHQDAAQDARLRGWLGVFKYQFTFLKGFFRDTSDVRANIQAEIFDAGDYYVQPDTGYYLRLYLTARL
jgi:hypothetical protein